MTCPHCRHENASQAKFCEECGAPLARRCSKCGNTLSASAKFCQECASPAGYIRSHGDPSRAEGGAHDATEPAGYAAPFSDQFDRRRLGAIMRRCGSCLRRSSACC
ncbi:MAG TPA: zinc ribbon domain-containing protein [Candidatus Dormibacteraeota bacterium]|nr:zinc ribbon domain-containing protein [Candidatus Dormibacteraeota bacterium]